ncbi:MAG TPA: ABC transporter permease [Blastocatellia bacterium]|nr:ABC transporter permease [Blastocatellia bacterium]
MPELRGRGKAAGFLEEKLSRARNVWAVRITTFAILLTVWEIYGQGISRALFAPPSEIARAYVVQVSEGTLLDAVALSMGSLLVGLMAGAIVGIFLGVLMGRSRTLEHLLDPYVSFLYATPTIALIPVLIIWFGIGTLLRMFLVFLSAVFLVIINTMVGVKQVDPELIDIGRSNCATEYQILRTIVLPGALPFIFGGLRLALAQSLVGVIVAEMTTTVTGLGALVITFSNFFQTANMMVPILTIMMISILLTEVMRRLQRRLTPWERSWAERP